MTKRHKPLTLQDINRKGLIVERVTERELGALLAEGLETGVVGGEQWFREPDRWYRMPAFINPYQTQYHEIPALTSNRQELQRHLTGTLKVFYGVGIGDSEAVPIAWDLEESGYAEVIAIDVIRDFLEGFVECLLNLIEEYPSSQIRFLGNNTLFEKLGPADVGPASRFDRRTFICLGNTVGNFAQDDIFSIFKRNADVSDFLLIGVQAAQKRQKLLRQYRKTLRYQRLIADSLSRGLQSLGRTDLDPSRLENLDWRYDEKKEEVQAWLNGVLIYHSRKYNLHKLSRFARKFGFVEVERFLHGDCSLLLFEKRE